MSTFASYIATSLRSDILLLSYKYVSVLGIIVSLHISLPFIRSTPLVIIMFEGPSESYYSPLINYFFITLKDQFGCSMEDFKMFSNNLNISFTIL